MEKDIIESRELQGKRKYWQVTSGRPSKVIRKLSGRLSKAKNMTNIDITVLNKRKTPIWS